MENTYLHQLKDQPVRYFSDFAPEVPSHWVLSHENDADVVIIQDTSELNSAAIFFDSNSLKLRKKNLSSFLKNFNFDFKESAKLEKILTKKSIKSSNALSNLFLSQSVKSLNEFMMQLLDSEQTSFANSLHLVTHIKGSGKATYTIIENSNFRTQAYTVENFQEVFSTVKKSKQSTFAESPLKSSQISVAGTCLAKSLQLKTHNLVLLATRNEFMPFSSEEIDQFNHFVEINKPLIEVLLEKEDDLIMTAGLEELTTLSSKLQFPDQEMKKEFHSKRISLLGDLLNTLRHELSNPLFGIQLSAQVLEELFDSEDDKEMCQQIRISIDKCLGIINEFSKMYDQKSGPIYLNLKKFIEEIFVLTKSETKSIYREIKLDSKLEAISEDQGILINPTWFSQILFNLIINSSHALKNFDISKPQIDIFIEMDGDKIVLNFHDNGPGISSQDQEKIFDPFFTTKDSGTGLGLSISANLAQKLGGSLQCAKSDKGAHFILVLPYEYPAS